MVYIHGLIDLYYDPLVSFIILIFKLSQICPAEDASCWHVCPCDTFCCRLSVSSSLSPGVTRLGLFPSPDISFPWTPGSFSWRMKSLETQTWALRMLLDVFSSRPFLCTELHVLTQIQIHEERHTQKHVHTSEILSSYQWVQFFSVYPASSLLASPSSHHEMPGSPSQPCAGLLLSLQCTWNSFLILCPHHCKIKTTDKRPGSVCNCPHHPTQD